MEPVRRHFVIYTKPDGDAIPQPIESWDILRALAMAPEGNVPAYAFRFETHLFAVGEFEGKARDLLVERENKSPIYYMGGELLMHDRIATDKERETLAWNMKNNKAPIAIAITRRWTRHEFFCETDIQLDPRTGEVMRRGDDPHLKRYRAVKLAEWEALDRAAEARRLLEATHRSS